MRLGTVRCCQCRASTETGSTSLRPRQRRGRRHVVDDLFSDGGAAAQRGRRRESTSVWNGTWGRRAGGARRYAGAHRHKRVGCRMCTRCMRGGHPPCGGRFRAARIRGASARAVRSARSSRRAPRGCRGRRPVAAFHGRRARNIHPVHHRAWCLRDTNGVARFRSHPAGR